MGRTGPGKVPLPVQGYYSALAELEGVGGARSAPSLAVSLHQEEGGLACYPPLKPSVPSVHLANHPPVEPSRPLAFPIYPFIPQATHLTI